MSELTFTTPRPVQFEVKVPSGDLHATTVDGEESTVTIDGTPKLVESIHVELVGDRLFVEQPRRSVATLIIGRDEWVRVTARIPHRSGVAVSTASGNVTLDGTYATVEMSTASGDVRVTGEIEGDARLKSASGDARFPHVAGSVSAQTVSGNLVADEIDGSVTVKAVSGDVRIGSLRDGRVTVNNVSGDIALGIAAGSQVDVDAGSVSGALASEVPLSEDGNGGDGPTVVIRGNTVSGDVRIFRAA